jgi:hypothetical protein
LAYHDETLRDLPCNESKPTRYGPSTTRRLATFPRGCTDDPCVGDVWTWTALDADTKLMVACWVDGRDVLDAAMFLQDFHA